MNWGDPIRCHRGESVFADSEFMVWRDADPEGARIKHPDSYPPLPDGVLGSPYGYPFRTCGYCGSIHPGDLYALLPADTFGTFRRAVDDGERRVTLGGADWKYGWPHKFYVEGIPNPIAGRLVVSSSTSRWDDAQQKSVTTWGEPHPAAPFTHAKFYNVHLLDLDAEAFALMAPVLFRDTGIEFSLSEGKLAYRAPYRGYQR